MVVNNEGYVALFIDWDNLAISVAADLGGASPDLKRIIQTAQHFGRILIARAYAEWNATSERLNVYRSGVEPVYAPTFRFEPDPLTQGARGKSLADPCMVADCIDILHLLPNITTFVIVSGDKDLIPVVRLAQLRGKHVVVIGPDYAAGVLRDIADEFISYRTVVEAGDGRVPEAAAGDALRGGRRPSQPRTPQQTQTSGGRRGRPSVTAQPAPRPRPREATLAEQVEAALQIPPEVAEAAKVEEPAETVSGKESANDLATVYATVVDILRQRTGEGKVRLRATNLKDNLMARVPGFTERKYGFAKFKDFLLAAQKAGVVSVSVAGPVHWVSLPGQLEEARETAEPAIAQESMAPAETTEVIGIAEESLADVVKFIIDLRSRSRWLTYTYVLTNLISYLGKMLPQANAESAARSTLNRLVQEGILRIDREPQEVEVGGIKHRVRMCHLEENHPSVNQAIEAMAVEKQKVEEELAPAHPFGETDYLVEAEEAEAERPQGEEAAGEAQALPSETEAREEEVGHGALDEMVEAVPVESPTATTDTSAVAEQELTTVETLEETQSPPLEAAHEPVAAESHYEEHHREEHAAEPTAEAPSHEQGGAIAGLGASLSLDEAYAMVDKVVRKSASSGKPRVRLTGLKAKLTGELGHFDEQVYGFKRFKDFLLAAERAEYVKLETAGPVVWVTLPDESATPKETELEAHAEQPATEQQREVQPATSHTAKPARSSRRRSQAKSREVLVER